MSKEKSVNIAILTISDTRNPKTDRSGQTLLDLLKMAGHNQADYCICPDNIYQIRKQLSHWIADSQIQVIITNGGTGFSRTDCTVKAVQPLLDEEIQGFGELFRQLSVQQIGCSTIQSNCLAGIANQTLIVSLPGSTNACQLGWNDIIKQQIDRDYKPCNFYHLWQ